jgi:serine/threonine protein kinase
MMEDIYRPGSQLTGRTLGTCTLQQLIGRGGMGAVYLAQQLRPRRTVAVKVLLPELFSNPEAFSEFLARFRREADAIAALDHINIMPIYEYGEEGQLAYLVMPYVSGGTLRDVIAKRGKLPLLEAITIVEQVAAALDYAHQHGIIHRDLKPGNILFHTDGRLLLTDFGIAKVLNEPTNENAPAVLTLTSTGMMIGTPEYLSPEQAMGLPIDNRSDIYSLGIVLFQLLSGRVPFSGTTAVAVAIKHATEEPPALTQFNPEVTPAVWQVILKALAKQPEQRYVTAGDFARALRAVAENERLIDHDAPTIMPDLSATAAVSSSFAAEAVIDTRPSIQEKFSYEPTVAAVQPVIQPASQPRSRLPRIVAVVSGLLVVVLILGGLAFFEHWLPIGNQLASGVNTSHTTTKTTPKPSHTTSPSLAALPAPAVPVGKLLYGAPVPICGAQSSLWSTNPAVQVTCDPADAHLTNTNSGQVEGVYLNNFPANAPIPNDYVIQVQVKPASSGAIGIFFRTQTSAAHGGYSFIIQPSGFWSGNSIDNSTGQTSSIFEAQGTALSSTSFTTIDIIVQDGTFQLYFNGVKQGGIQSNNYSSGILGLAVAGGADAMFKNLAIYALP